MRPFIVAATAVLLVVATSFASRPAEAKCGGPMLDIAPHESKHDYAVRLEAEWGETVRLSGYCWVVWVAGEPRTADEVDVFARFLPDHPSGNVRELSPDPSLAITGVENGGFDELFRLDDVYGAPEQPQAGWIEFTARAGGEGVRTSMEAHRSIVITAGGQRPPGSAYVAGRVHGMPSPPHGIYVVWAPVDDPGAYGFAPVPNGGEYRTDYLSEGEWFIGIYDINEEQQAVGPELRRVAGYSRELDKEVTLNGRTVAVTDAQPLAGLDFSLSAPPASAQDPAPIETALDEPEPSIIGADEAPVSPAKQVETEPDSTVAGWLGPALLATGGGLILTLAATMRWRWHRLR